MRQLITRIDEELHQRLRARARAEGRSVAALVREVLEEATRGDAADAAVRRLERAGMVWRPEPPESVLSHEELRERTRGAGGAVRRALDEDRASR